MRKLIGCTLLIALVAAAGGYAYWPPNATSVIICQIYVWS